MDNHFELLYRNRIQELLNNMELTPEGVLKLNAEIRGILYLEYPNYRSCRFGVLYPTKLDFKKGAASYDLDKLHQIIRYDCHLTYGEVKVWLNKSLTTVKELGMTKVNICMPTLYYCSDFSKEYRDIIISICGELGLIYRIC